MSNTSTVTPYRAQTLRSENTTSNAAKTDSSAAANTDPRVAAGFAAACVMGAIVGVAGLARWLGQKSEQDKKAIQRLKEARSRELLDRSDLATPVQSGLQAESLTVKSVNLQLTNPDSLVRVARQLGYRTGSSERSANAAIYSPILLESNSGERLAIARDDSGRLVIHTVGDLRRVQDLVREHTVTRASEHLAAKGMRIQSATLPNGEVQIMAIEQGAQRRGGAAEIRAQVNVDGTTTVDVDKVRGNRCEEIVREFADAIGGEVSTINKKPSYYQLPGEPAETRLKVR